MFSVTKKVHCGVFALFVLVGVLTVGCGDKEKPNGWMNTNSLPGHTFKQNRVKTKKSKVIYLGSDYSHKNKKFGPGSISFEFEDLK